MKEAFYLAKTGRPGPILIDFPKNIQLATLDGEIDWDPPFRLPGYNPDPKPVSKEQIRQVIAAIKRSHKPILYVGGGVINSGCADELTKFAKKSGIRSR